MQNQKEALTVLVEVPAKFELDEKGLGEAILQFLKRRENENRADLRSSRS